MASDAFWDSLSSIFGWISFVLWSCSFYPQTWQNYCTKSVAGFSVEFAMLNPVGFYFYTIYNLQGLVDPAIGNTGTIYTNDLFFAVHAVALASIQFTQIFMYDNGKQKSINWYVVAFLCVEFTAIGTVFGIELNRAATLDQNWGTIRLCGYCKAAITFIKYMPQVYLNWQRKSTVGWSIENVMLDFFGGAFSFSQLVVDSTARGKPLFGGGGDQGFNIVKFLLSIFAMMFDIIFLIQHYVLYRGAWEHETKVTDRLDRLEKVQQSFNEMNTAGKDGRNFLAPSPKRTDIGFTNEHTREQISLDRELDE